jgi:hypothetical protein
MIRPKKEDFVMQYSYSFGTWDEVDNEAYQEALEKYVDQLEEALDKACEELEKWDINNFDNTTVTKEQWKEELMKDEED